VGDCFFLAQIPAMAMHSMSSSRPRTPHDENIRASRMQMAPWYELNTQLFRDKQAAEREAAEKTVAANLAAGLTSTGSVKRQRTLHASLFEGELGFFVPEHNSRLQLMRLQQHRPRFEPLRRGHGMGGGLAMGNASIRSAASLRALQPASKEIAAQLQRSASADALPSATRLSGIKPLHSIPSDDSLVPGAWHHNFPRYPAPRNYLRSAGVAC
tara:strand:+ start:136 stop:774 length:639 start_codon:yes stop_codon:yes gene_type:complete